MKKILSLALAGVMMFSALPMAYAADADYTAGTQVSYNAEDPNGDGVLDNQEAYTVTVPAQLAPAGEGNVVAEGTWNSARKLVVSADATVTLTNSINAADQKVLDITFPGIALVGDNTQAVADTKVVSVAEMPADALFGTWSGVFEYDVEMVDNVAEEEANTISFTISYRDDYQFEAEEGMTWAAFIESEYNSTSFVVAEGENVYIDDGSGATTALFLDSTMVLLTDTIVADATYVG